MNDREAKKTFEGQQQARSTISVVRSNWDIDIWTKKMIQQHKQADNMTLLTGIYSLSSMKKMTISAAYLQS